MHDASGGTPWSPWSLGGIAAYFCRVFDGVFFHNAFLFFIAAVTPCLLLIAVQFFFWKRGETLSGKGPTTVSGKEAGLPSLQEGCPKALRALAGTVFCVFGLAVFYGLTKRYPPAIGASALSAGAATGAGFVGVIAGVKVSRVVLLEYINRALSVGQRVRRAGTLADPEVDPAIQEELRAEVDRRLKKSNAVQTRDRPA